jgi:hypothetical protein
MNPTKCTYSQFEYTTITYHHHHHHHILHVLALSGPFRKITDTKDASDIYRPSLGNAAYAYTKNTAAS